MKFESKEIKVEFSEVEKSFFKKTAEYLNALIDAMGEDKFMQNMDYGNIYETDALIEMVDFFYDIAEHPIELLDW